MKTIAKLIIASYFIICVDTILYAQPDRETDSTEIYSDDLTSLETEADTVLNRSEFETHPDVKQYKSDKNFAYMKYLDSLLRQTKDLTVDTFTIGSETPPRSKREASPNTPQNQPTINIFSSPIVKIILWILAALLIAFIIYKLFLGENFFRRNRTYKTAPDTQKQEEDISDPAGYDTLIAQAVKNKDYRLAIRYSYLQILKKLSASDLLQFSADKTNYQYVSELRGKPYQNDFAAITLNYEYVWYGKFDISEDVYHRLSAEYKSFNKKIN